MWDRIICWFLKHQWDYIGDISKQSRKCKRCKKVEIRVLENYDTTWEE